MGEYKKMWLARRVGPLLQGIILERSSSNDDYLPTSHIQSLCCDQDWISLTLAQRLRTEKTRATWRISVRGHSIYCNQAARSIREASLLPLEGAISLGQLAAAVGEYEKLGEGCSRFPIHLMQDVVALHVYCGQIEKAGTLVEEYAARMQDWPVDVLKAEGGVDGWREGQQRVLGERERLIETVEKQAARFRLEALPVSSLVP